MAKHEGCKRAYTRSSKAWYSHVLEGRIDVSIGMYHPEGGTSGEFMVEWVSLGDNRPTNARLKSFDDSWNALWLFKDLLQIMSGLDDQNIQEPEFCEILESLGIIDITEYEHGKSKLHLLL